MVVAEAVNVSAATLALPDDPQLVGEALGASGVLPERLHLEVTETALLIVTASIGQQIQQLASSGVRWYVDDFGTGSSSISHLRDLPIAGLKLDRSFTCAMRAKDTKSLRLAQALVGVAEGLELDMVAEGGRNRGGGPPARLPGLAARSGLALRQGGPPATGYGPVSALKLFSPARPGVQRSRPQRPPPDRWHR
jgi:predicted signal transduction protein with EAL and GGDEF domain